MSARIDAVRAGVTNTYIIRDGGAILIDPGGVRQSGAVLRALRRLLDDPRQIRLMIATHGHFDHIGAAASLRAALGAPLAVHLGDADWIRRATWTWPAGVTGWGRIMRHSLGPVLRTLSRFPPLEPDRIFGDEGLDLEPYGVSGKVVYTPGHSPGSVSVLLESGDVFVGDLAMNGLPMCLKPSFGIFAHQPELVPASWRRLLDLGARTVYPAHGRPFPASRLAIVH